MEKEKVPHEKLMQACIVLNKRGFNLDEITEKVGWSRRTVFKYLRAHPDYKPQKGGFATMSKELRVKIASMGGTAAHRKGVAHTWSKDEARIAGKKGGRARKNKK